MPRTSQTVILQILPQSLALAAALSRSTTHDGQDARTLGGIAPDDLNNLSPVPPPVSSTYRRQRRALERVTV
ncbi:hypothetical protein BD310DRAFT_921847 [Dichomitus squalens]|uniref:Secreted protein n=1 Tax=Dichomitus squalens TaxID=114155 RepID=A0A4Q9Q288_9APHY|nr:hypothetical protein BD310DRAFT_921847 [Dichomitus squalens]